MNYLVICLSAVALYVASPSTSMRSRTQSSEVPAAELEQADAWFQAKDWEHAAKAYEAIAQRQPKNGPVLYRLGLSLHSLGHFERAIPVYLRAVELNQNPVVMYKLACSYARTQHIDDAFHWLDRALVGGFAQLPLVQSDPELASLRKDARYADILKRTELNAFPCVNAPHAREFDFWIGEWVVHDTLGTQVGTSSIQLILGQCVILENWTNMGGNGGKSLNVYNREKQKWQQTWADDQGDVIEFVNGEFKDGAMRFEAEKLLPDGTRTLRKLSFFPLAPDKVRQFSEGSNDAGKTWFVEYDFLYTRKKA